MAERDRAAVDVHALRVEPELADDHEALRRERLVQLDEIDVRDVDPGALEELAHGGDRSDAHHARVDPGNRAPRESPERLHSKLLRALLTRDHERSGPVVDTARITRGDGTALAKRRLEVGELVGARFRPRMLVADDVA